MTFFETLLRFLSPMKDSPGIFFRASIQGFLWAIQGVIHVYFIQKIITQVTDKNLAGLQTTLAFYFAYIILYEVSEFTARNWGWVEAVPKAKALLSKKYIPQFLKIDNNTVESIGTGKLVSILEKGIDTWTDWLYFIFERGLSFTVIFLYVLFQLYVNNLLYTLIYIFIIFLLSVLGYFLNQKTLIERNKKNEYKSLYTKQLVKIIMSKFEILQSNKIDKEVKELNYFMHQIYLLNISVGRYINPYFRIPEFLLGFGKLLLCYFMGTAVISGDLKIGAFVGIITSLILMDKALENFLKIYKDFTRDYSAIENLWQFFDNSPQIRGYEKGETFEIKNGDIKVENLTFFYHEKRKVFENFDLEITGEKITALVGPSGGGKSTLVKLIAGYIHPHFGDIIVDNQKIRDLSLKSYYQDIGYLTQDPSVFDGSVRENLTYALQGKDVPEKKLKEAIAMAHATFIYDLPKGLETQIGERGVKLSGGQKQRLAIAKIFLKDPKIIILDEPTSALDSFSEERITEAMHNLFKGRTVIVIAHRLQTVKNADDIIVIEAGKIIERGTHNSLIRRNGYYKKMLDLQSGF